MKKKTLYILILSAVIVAAYVLLFMSSNSYVQSVMNMLLYNIVLVLGLNFITGLTGQMNMATAGMMALGAYSFAISDTTYNVNPWLSLLLVLVLGLAIGRALGYPSLRLQGFFLSLTTIGFNEVVRITVNNLTEITGGATGYKGVNRLPFFFQFPDKNSYFYLNLIFTLVMIAIAVLVVNSKWGRAYKSIRDNYEAAEATGIDIAKLKIQAFTMAAIYSVVAGVMYAGYTQYLNPTAFATSYSQNYVAMLMVGGIGNVAGNILGAALVTVLPEFLRAFQNYYWVMFCSICLLMAIFVPDGLWSLFQKAVRFVQKKMNKGKEVA
ncbi:MAG: branched-chain amino acid ABC transporter permease [Erysipelotrichaceae bacterium]|nr:branched-chain amino acid ABC transporter permease [Erysipelotrichaceae bacterium]